MNTSATPSNAKVSEGNPDIIGQLLLIVGIIGLLYGVSQIGRSFTSPSTLVPLLGGVLILAGFFIREAKSKEAFYPVHLFKSKVFIAAILAGLIYNLGNSVVFLQTANLWQYVTDLKTSEVAIWQLPFIAAGILGAVIIGKLMNRGMSDGVALLIGAGTAAVGMVLLAMVHSSKSLLAFTPGLILAGGGLIIASIVFGNLFLNESPPDKVGPVTSSKTTIGQFFYSIGFALGTVVIDKMTTGGVIAKLGAAGVPPANNATALNAVTVYASNDTDPSTALGKQALEDAMVSYGNAYTHLDDRAGSGNRRRRCNRLHFAPRLRGGKEDCPGRVAGSCAGSNPILIPTPTSKINPQRKVPFHVCRSDH